MKTEVHGINFSGSEKILGRIIIFGVIMFTISKGFADISATKNLQLPSIEDIFQCDTCELAKSHRVPFTLSSNKSLVPFSLVQSDVWGPAKIATPAGERWFVTFLDDCTRMIWVSLLKTKGEVSSRFQQFYQMVETHSYKIMTLYINAHALYSPTEWVSKRKSRHLLEVVHASLFGVNMPQSFWGEAVVSAAYLIHRIPSINWITESKSVFSLAMHLIRNDTSVIILLVRKSILLCMLCSGKTTNFSAAQEEYCDTNTSQIFHFFPPESSQSKSDRLNEEETNEILPTPETFSAPVPHQSHVEDVIQVTSCPETDNTNEISHDNLISEGTEPTYQLPDRKNRDKPRVQYEANLKAKRKYPIKLSESRVHYVKQLADISVPNSITEALEDPKWKKAMNKEMRALQKNVTWELMPLPHGKKTVGCKWIYTMKVKADRSVERYKAKLEAKGYTQRYGIDYEETFAPVAKISTIRVLLSLVANLDWPLHLFDVKNAFLHGHLEEEVYMDLPSRCNLAHDKGSQSNANLTLFLKRDGRRLTTLIVYVDDIVVTGNDTGEQLKLQKYLSKEFEMKDLGDLKYFLGIKYVLDLLTKTGMLGCKPADTPIKMNHKLCEDMDQEPTNKKQYQRLVGRLIYLAHTKPDIAYAVSVVSQLMHLPSVSHRKVVDQILRYLKSATGKGLMFSKKEISKLLDIQMLTGLARLLIYSLFHVTSLLWESSAEAEYQGMAHGVCELLWIRRLLTELSFKQEKPMELHCDSKSATNIAHNPVQHDRTKHVEEDRQFIKEKIEKKITRLPFVRSEDQLANILTKVVCGRVFHNSLTKLGIGDEADDLDIPHGFAGDNERHVVDTIGSMVDRIPGAFPSLPAAIIDSTQDVDKVGSATQGAEGTLPALPPLERPGATTYTVLAALRDTSTSKGIPYSAEYSVPPSKGPEHSILPHLPATLPCSEITDGDCQIGGTSVESALVGHLLEKSLSWLDWESCFIAFKAFFESGVKILRSIDELLPLCHRFNSYVTFRGAFLYPETIEVLGRFMDRYGGFMESTWTVSTFSRSAALRGLGLVLHGIDTMQLLDIIDHRLLCWRDAICEAITLGFHVDFLLDLLRNPAHAIFGVRAILNLMRQLLLVPSHFGTYPYSILKFVFLWLGDRLNCHLIESEHPGLRFTIREILHDSRNFYTNIY
ncbi:HXXXD-type acyl-transferase family protein [Prunus dulcis]|uniref:HXXXD-type acyl-transferase family protein n=1 Tax=Prunus dulcis TaxID=3755 RepID=A0A4Y1RKW6_PRUDU|nr:HXXXD-type acyl-transferase family protein [Prunus dulcis]